MKDGPKRLDSRSFSSPSQPACTAKGQEIQDRQKCRNEANARGTASMGFARDRRLNSGLFNATEVGLTAERSFDANPGKH